MTVIPTRTGYANSAESIARLRDRRNVLRRDAVAGAVCCLIVCRRAIGATALRLERALAARAETSD